MRSAADAAHRPHAPVPRRSRFALPVVRDRRAAAAAVLFAVLGSTLTAMGVRAEPTLPPPVAAPVATATASPSADRGEASPPDDRGEASPPDDRAGAMPRSVPVRLSVPAIGVDTAVMKLGLRGDGTLQVPPLRADAPAGWYEHSPTPGEPGASVIAGHVDTAREGAAVFFRLRELTPGDIILVRRADRSVARFAVRRVLAYPKDDFPTAAVYGPVSYAALRLVTCGGTLDRDRGSYRDNVVVFAEAVPEAVSGS
ncbi:hypothetical protein Acsp01_71630 [Actinoplanes sp. NBRC 101535]|nr:hypothetical protein Acsp01_71630 [Actinoplanes sp. NBRC 101535]